MHTARGVKTIETKRHEKVKKEHVPKDVGGIKHEDIGTSSLHPSKSITSSRRRIPVKKSAEKYIKAGQPQLEPAEMKKGDVTRKVVELQKKKESSGLKSQSKMREKDVRKSIIPKLRKFETRGSPPLTPHKQAIAISKIPRPVQKKALGKNASRRRPSNAAGFATQKNKLGHLRKSASIDFLRSKHSDEAVSGKEHSSQDTQELFQSEPFVKPLNAGEKPELSLNTAQGQAHQHHFLEENSDILFYRNQFEVDKQKYFPFAKERSAQIQKQTSQSAEMSFTENSSTTKREDLLYQPFSFLKISTGNKWQYEDENKDLDLSVLTDGQNAQFWRKQFSSERTGYKDKDGFCGTAIDQVTQTFPHDGLLLVEADNSGSECLIAKESVAVEVDQEKNMMLYGMQQDSFDRGSTSTAVGVASKETQGSKTKTVEKITCLPNKSFQGFFEDVDRIRHKGMMASEIKKELERVHMLVPCLGIMAEGKITLDNVEMHEESSMVSSSSVGSKQKYPFSPGTKIKIIFDHFCKPEGSQVEINEFVNAFKQAKVSFDENYFNPGDTPGPSGLQVATPATSNRSLPNVSSTCSVSDSSYPSFGTLYEVDSISSSSSSSMIIHQQENSLLLVTRGDTLLEATFNENGALIPVKDLFKFTSEIATTDLFLDSSTVNQILQEVGDMCLLKEYHPLSHFFMDVWDCIQESAEQGAQCAQLSLAKWLMAMECEGQRLGNAHGALFSSAVAHFKANTQDDEKNGVFVQKLRAAYFSSLEAMIQAPFKSKQEQFSLAMEYLSHFLDGADGSNKVDLEYCNQSNPEQYPSRQSVSRVPRLSPIKEETENDNPSFPA